MKNMYDFDVETFLARHGVKQLRANGDWVNGTCPFHDDRTPSFGMHRNYKNWKCFVCGGGDFLSFLTRYYGVDNNEAIKKWPEFVWAAERARSESLKEKLGQVFRKKQIDLPVYDPLVVERWRYVHPYMLSRGIKDIEVFHHFRCGYCPEKNLLTFPIFFQGSLVSVLSRRLDDQKPKYFPYPGFAGPKIFYNFCPEYSEVILVEGVFDVLWLWQCGYRNVMGILGNMLTSVQEAILSVTCDKVILWMDNDFAGKEGGEKISKKLGGRIEVSVVEGEKKDPAEHSLAEVARVLASQKSLCEINLQGRFKLARQRTD